MQFWYAHDDRRTADKFVLFCKSNGVHGKLRIWDHHWKFRVTISLTGKELEEFTAGWSRESITRQN